ncbi:MAG: TonB-dependent receptor [Bacteroidetes bacterium]|nr:TonB-dependent receptor [Bacteroidota bacterium]MCL2301778.1 TonB-dependent receptor [Lentimicrobiaceae bacterium]
MNYKFSVFSFQFSILLSSFSFLLSPFSSLHSQTLPTDSIAAHELMSVEVLERAPISLERTFSATTITRPDIRNNIGNGSINNLFDLIPSMITTSDAGTGLGATSMRLRGIDQTRINVTFNGIALNDAESQGSWLVNLPDLGAVTQSLNVQRGVGMSNNGAAAFGASMNFSTLQATYKPFVELTSAAGSFYTFRNSVTASTGMIKDVAAVTVSYSNILSNGYIDNAHANLNSLFFSGDVFLPKKRKENVSKLRLNIFYGNERTGLAWDGVPSDSLKTNRRFNGQGLYYDAERKLQRYENETDNYQQTHCQLFYDYKNSKKRFDMNIGAHLTRGIGYYEQYRQNRRFSEYGLPNFAIGDTSLSRSDFITRRYLDNYFYGMVFNVTKEFAITEEHVLFLTTRAALNNYDGKHYGNIIWGKYLGSVPPNYEWYGGVGNKLQSNIVASLGYTYKGWFAYIDFQYRYINYKITGTNNRLQDITQNHVWDKFFNPKAALSYSWQKRQMEQTTYLSFAVANREPTRSDLVNALPGKTPQPETLYNFELGYTLNMNKFRFNANSYYMLYDNQLVLTGEINSTGAAVMTNVKDSYRLGLELVANYQPVKFFQWKIAGTFSTNKIRNYEHLMENYDEDAPNEKYVSIFRKNTTISFSPAIVASNVLQFYPFKNFGVNLTTQFVSKQYIDNLQDNNHVLKPYCVSNLNLSYDIPKLKKMNLSLFFSVNNVFNTMYESNAWLWRALVNGKEVYDDGYFPQAGINFFGGVKIRF